MLYSTLLNVGTIVLGSIIGALLAKFFDKSKRLKKLPDALMKAISLCVIFIGIKGAFDSKNFLIILISIVVGTTVGSLIKIDSLLKRFGNFMERRLVKKKSVAIDDPNNPITANAEGEEQKSFSRAFVSTTLTCCVGAMAITGSLNAGMNGDHSLIITKSVLDFITAFVYSSAFGIGAIMASIPVLLYQGIIVLGAGALSGVLTASVSEISAVGSIIIVGLGLNMLGATKIKVANMLPAVFVPILLCALPIFQ
ncbi:MAG: DUF554 domain-containing protein [Clostridia bacterium]|nr:DUF554 domain-containing protein [Clostridia bacterium]